MKTIRIITIAFAAFFMVSCDTSYRMVTTLNRDGKTIREIYATGDSAFMAGNTTNNPYLFDISPDWEITRFDPATKYNFFGSEKNFNVKISKSAASIDQFSKELKYDLDKRSFAAPVETLTKKFSWFYTNYKFTGVYKKLDYNAPVSINTFLSAEEQKLWSQGDFSPYGAMNGMEMNDMLGKIEEKFMNWYSLNLFEISLACIEKRSTERIPDVDKEKIYKQLMEQNRESEITPDNVYPVLDSYYKTTRFLELYKTNEKNIDQEFEELTAIVNLLCNTISYELVVPGKILLTNSPIVNSNTLTWKVDGIRILFDDYTLTAEFRTANIWAFILSGLILITASASIILLRRRKHQA